MSEELPDPDSVGGSLSEEPTHHAPPPLSSSKPPSRLVSREHLTGTYLREREAMADVRLGQAQNSRGGTIIAKDEPVFDKRNGNVIIEEDVFRSSQNFQGALYHSRSEVEEVERLRARREETFLEIIARSLEAVIGYVHPSWSGGENRSNVEEHEDVSDEDLDALAVFQGKLKDFLALREAVHGPVAAGKVARMKRLLRNEYDPQWEERCKRLLSPICLDCIIDFKSPRSKLKVFLGAWNPDSDHCSNNLFLMDDQLTIHRNPLMNQSDAVRSKLGVMSGCHAWDLRMTGPIGSHLSVGVATDKGQLLSSTGYVTLIGDDKESWGWDVVWGNLSHGGKIMTDYPAEIIYDYTPGDVIRLILNCDLRELSFVVNELNFGVAFNNLPRDIPLYPAAGLVYGSMEVSLVYLGVPPPPNHSYCFPCCSSKCRPVEPSYTWHTWKPFIPRPFLCSPDDPQASCDKKPTTTTTATT